MISQPFHKGNKQQRETSTLKWCIDPKLKNGKIFKFIGWLTLVNLSGQKKHGYYRKELSNAEAKNIPTKTSSERWSLRLGGKSDPTSWSSGPRCKKPIRYDPTRLGREKESNLPPGQNNPSVLAPRRETMIYGNWDKHDHSEHRNRLRLRKIRGMCHSHPSEPTGQRNVDRERERRLAILPSSSANSGDIAYGFKTLQN